MIKAENIIGKLKNNKVILVILIIGVIFLFIPEGSKEEVRCDGNYEKEFTEKTKGILEEIEGAGRVSLVISFYDKGKTVPLTDKSENGETINEKTVSTSGKVALLKEEYPSVRGVVVVCDGGGNEGVREDIINAVSALTGAPLHNIKVFKMGD